MGPTGSGKSHLAEALASHWDAQLVNADAFQVYRGLDIGTNKPKDRGQYELLDLVEPTETMGVGLWVLRAKSVLENLWAQGRSAVIVGGTGLYVRALFEEYSDLAPAPPESLRQQLMERERSEGPGVLADELVRLQPDTVVDLKNPVRVRRALERHYTHGQPQRVALPPFRKMKLGMDVVPEVLDVRLKERTLSLLSEGWPEEVAALLQKGVPLSAPGFRAIGYLSVAGFLSGETDWDRTVESVYRATRQYAKRQRTWLRSEPGLVKVQATSPGDDEVVQAALRLLTVKE